MKIKRNFVFYSMPKALLMQWNIKITDKMRKDLILLKIGIYNTYKVFVYAYFVCDFQFSINLNVKCIDGMQN